MNTAFSSMRPAPWRLVMPRILLILCITQNALYHAHRIIHLRGFYSSSFLLFPTNKSISRILAKNENEHIKIFAPLATGASDRIGVERCVSLFCNTQKHTHTHTQHLKRKKSLLCYRKWNLLIQIILWVKLLPSTRQFITSIVNSWQHHVVETLFSSCSESAEIFKSFPFPLVENGVYASKTWEIPIETNVTWNSLRVFKIYDLKFMREVY